MWPRLSIVLGLVAGVAAGALILGALLFLTPDPGAGASPTAPPSPPPSASPSATASPSSSAAPSATATPSAGPSFSPKAGPSASASPSSSAAALFHDRIDRGGSIRDGARGGLGPDVMARGRTTILPGVEVAP